MASSYTYAFFHCHYAFQKFPFFFVTLCVLHALQNATESHSVEVLGDTKNGNFWKTQQKLKKSKKKKLVTEIEPLQLAF